MEKNIDPSGKFGRDPYGLSAWVRIPRFLYTRLGIKRGVGRAVMSQAKRRKWLHVLPVRVKDGRILYLDLREPMSMNYLLAGEIWMEKGPTVFARSVLRSGETAIDIGANVGWYSTLFSELVGQRGKVYGFEPSTKAFGLVSETATLYPQLEIIRAALSNYEGSATLHIPSDGGMASLHDLPGTMRKQQCQVTTLNAFLKTKNNPIVQLIKCDAEGAEISILQGASTLLGSERPPIWLMEISTPSAQRFGYHPDRIIEYFQSFAGAGYRAFKINALTGELSPLNLPLNLVRDDAIIVPQWQSERLDVYLQTLSEGLLDVM